MSEDNLVLRVRLMLKGRPIKSYSFEQDVITIGRDPEADIFLDNPGISREHARLERMPNGFFCLKDLGSANGTYLNDQTVQSSMIYDSDVVRVGKFSLWLAIERDRRTAEQPPTEVRRAYSEFAPETTMLSTDELERLIKASRDPAKETPGAHPPERMRGAPTHAPAPAVVRQPSTRGSKTLVGIGLIVILATSLGAGFAWLFLR